MKQLMILTLLLVTACMPAQKEYTVIREQSRSAIETPAPTCPAQKPACPTMTRAAEAPVYYAGTVAMQQPTVQFMVPAQTYMPSPMMTAPVMTTPMMAAPTYTYQQQAQPQQPMAGYQMQETQTTTVAGNGSDTTLTEDSSIVIMQHPSNRDLVKCGNSDNQCVLSYQSAGYVQLRNAPHFAGHNDVPSDSDYPTRRWRDNNDIPRW